MCKAESEIKSFNNLTFDEQANKVWRFSTLLVMKEKEEMRINLYYHDGFYVKMFYDKARMKILKFEAGSEDCLPEFLNEIKLKNLFT